MKKTPAAQQAAAQQAFDRLNSSGKSTGLVVKKPAARRVPPSAPVVVATPAGHHGIMSSEAVSRQIHKTHIVVGKWAPVLGSEPAQNFCMMVWGPPGQGKSTLLMKLGRDLASMFGPVLNVSNEEFGSKTVQDRQARCGGSMKGFDYSRNIPDNSLLKHYKFLILDSIQTLGMSLAQFKQLRLDNPHLAVIIVMQSTKSGNFKGENGWPHEVDIEIKAYGPGFGETLKNRYGPLRKFRIF